MSRRGGARYANDAAMLVGILLAIGLAVMLALPSESVGDAQEPAPEQTAVE